MPAHASPVDASTPTDARPVVDVAMLEDLVGDDPTFVRRFLAMYLHSARTQAGEIVTACAVGDSAGVGLVAHKLKGSSRSIGARALGDACAELESAGRDDRRGEMVEACRRFEQAMSHVDAFIVRRLAAI